MAKEKICGIYMIKNLINGKVYIGQSRGIKNRISRHKSDLRKNKHGNSHLQFSWNKYGIDNFEFSIVEECEVENLNDREIFWINFYESVDKNKGYNQKTGGGVGFILSDDYIKNMRDVKDKIAILQIDFDGNIIKEWSGAREASKILNISQSCIWSCVNNKRRTYKKYIWVEKKKYDCNTFNASNYKQGQPKTIAQVDFNYNLIKIWNGASEAQKSGDFDSSCIIKCCKYKKKYHKNYLWFYYEEYKNNKYIKNKLSNGISIIQLDKNYTYIKTWDSIVQAEKYFANKKTGNINRVLSGRNTTAYGYVWKYNKNKSFVINKELGIVDEHNTVFLK